MRVRIDEYLARERVTLGRDQHVGDAVLADREVILDAEALEQLQLELSFEIGQGAADRRLRHGQVLRGATDALVLGHGEEDFELAEGETHIGDSE